MRRLRWLSKLLVRLRRKLKMLQPDEQLHKFLNARAINVTRAWDGSWSVAVRQIIDEREAMRFAVEVLNDPPERWTNDIEAATVSE